MGAQDIGPKLLDDRLADAIVTGLDDLVAIAKPGANQALPAQ